MSIACTSGSADWRNEFGHLRLEALDFRSRSIDIALVAIENRYRDPDRRKTLDPHGPTAVLVDRLEILLDASPELKVWNYLASCAPQFCFSTKEILLRTLYRWTVADKPFENIVRDRRRFFEIARERRKREIRLSNGGSEASKVADIGPLRRRVIELSLFGLNFSLQDIRRVGLSDIC
jgi:hypothetical protein